LLPEEQAILVSWYLPFTGGLDLGDLLCYQSGIYCDNSSPYQRVIKMYFSFTDSKKKILKGSIINRSFNWVGLGGTIPTTFGRLEKLQEL